MGKIDSLTIDKKLSYKSFLCTNSSFDWYLLLNSSSNNTIQEKSNSFFGNGFSTSIDDFTPLVPLENIRWAIHGIQT
jgi:hypothetical protein